MVLLRVPESTAGFSRPYIWPGMYLADVDQIKWRRDDGLPFKTTYTQPDGQLVERDALVVIFKLLKAVGADPLDADGRSTAEQRRHMSGQTIGKKVTQSLHEKANLYAYWTAIMGSPPPRNVDIDLDQLVGGQCLVMIEDNTRFDQTTGEMRPGSFIRSVSPYIAVNEAPAPRRAPAPAPQPPGQGGAGGQIRATRSAPQAVAGWPGTQTTAGQPSSGNPWPPPADQPIRVQDIPDPFDDGGKDAVDF